jgi:hypothetical protein
MTAIFALGRKGEGGWIFLPRWATFPAVYVRALLLAIALAGCSNIRTGSEFDYAADFHAYRSYAWVTEELTLIGTGSGDPRVRNEQNERLIRAAIDRELAARGYEKVELSEAQLVVTFAVGLREEIRIEGADTTYGLLAADGPAPKYYEGRLTIDLFDRETRRHVWHGWGRESLDRGADPKVVIDEAVTAIMKPFPPDEK